MTLTRQSKQEVRIEHQGLSVLIEKLPKRGDGTVHVWASNKKAADRAYRLEALLSARTPTGSRGSSVRDYFYWWHNQAMPSEQSIRDIVEGKKAP